MTFATSKSYPLLLTLALSFTIGLNATERAAIGQSVKGKEPNRGGELDLKSVSPEVAKEHLVVAEGFEVELFASEKDFPLHNPVSMTWDAKGRLWVATMPSYPHIMPGEKPNDKIIILEDTNGDGKADKHTVFIDGLYLPTGFELGDGGVYIAQQPNLIFAKDTDGDDKADVVKTILHGFGSEDSHHSISAFTWGNGGGLYFQEGTFLHSQIETPYGPVRLENAGVFRYEPKSLRLEVFASYPFANPWGHVFDAWGQNFVADASGGANYFGTAFSGHIDYPRKHKKMKVFTAIVRPTAGCEIISSRHFPENMQGNFLVNNCIGFQGIKQHQMIETESGFTSKEVEPLLYSKDINFRPVDLQFGPDGSLYLVDWFNPLVGHMQYSIRDPRRDHSHGRIWRVRHKTRPLNKPVSIAKRSTLELFELLKSSEDRVRYNTRRELRARPKAEVVQACQTWLKSLDEKKTGYEHHLLEALWVLQGVHEVDSKLLDRVLSSPEPKSRAAATRVLCFWREKIDKPLVLFKKMANDPHPRVRLEAVRACSYFRDYRAAEVALEVLRYPTDYYLNYTLSETLRQLEQFYVPALSQGKSFALDNPKGVEYILEKLNAQALLGMHRSKPVCLAIISREGIVEADRSDAILQLSKLKGTKFIEELIDSIRYVDSNVQGGQENVMADLAFLLAGQDEADLRANREALIKLATSAKNSNARRVGYLALMVADNHVESAWKIATTSPRNLIDFLKSVSLLTDQDLKAELYPRILSLVDELPTSLQKIVGNTNLTIGRYVRITLPGRKRTLTLAEVQVFSGGENIALHGKAKQHSTASDGNAKRAIDGNISGEYAKRGQTHTRENVRMPWWEVDLGNDYPIEKITVYNRTDEKLGRRLKNFNVQILASDRNPVWQQLRNSSPKRNINFELSKNILGNIQKNAINALTYIPGHDEDLFVALSKSFISGNHRSACANAISSLRLSQVSEEYVFPFLQSTVEFIQSTPITERTTPEMLLTIQLAKDLARLLPPEKGRPFLVVLRDLGVQIVTIRPVPKLVRFDRNEVAIEAGKPVEIVFDNQDVMQHNLVIIQENGLDAVIAAAFAQQKNPAEALKQDYIPKTNQILWATPLLSSGESSRLKFIAPKKPGKYPFICTYPGHMKTMTGIIHVVPNLDVFLASYDLPEPEASMPTRTRVIKDYKYEDLLKEVNWKPGTRSFERGKQLFTEMSCITCHKMDATLGGSVGPNLARADMKLTRKELLKEMVNPSHKIDEKYAQWIFIANGKIYSGLVLEETKDYFSINEKPGVECNPTKLLKDNLDDDPEKSLISVMPEKLLNTMKVDEILNLLAYVEAKGDRGSAVYSSTSTKTSQAVSKKDNPWIVFEGKAGAGKGKNVVLISGDEEYRSEEALPQLAKILSDHHGFKCTVLFAIDPKDGTIKPTLTDNIPGLESLLDADLMILATRFRNLPDDQMKYIVDYLKSGRPVIGMRTATHAFRIPSEKKYAKFSWDYKGKDYKQGFGRQVLGETWINHHGKHGQQSTRGQIADSAKSHPILKGIQQGDIWSPTDVYGIRLPLPKNSKPLIFGQVLQGMSPKNAPVSGKLNSPMMPVAWTKTYHLGNGKEGRVFTTTLGASQDLESEGIRRLLTNACYWAVGLEDEIPEKAIVDLIGSYKPTPFGFGKFKKGLKPKDLKSN